MRMTVAGRRVLVTGAARGIGAALARRLHEQGARVGVVGLEPEGLARVAEECGGGPWAECDVGDREGTQRAVDQVVEGLGGLDVVVANAGIAKQLALVGGEVGVLEETLRVNLLGVFNTVRATGAHVSHDSGYVLMVASLAAAVQVPLLGAYSVAKAGVEALGNTLRVELRHTGARVGVAYFAELDTDMTKRGFGTRAAAAMSAAGSFNRVTPVEVAIGAMERGIARRARTVVAPGWVRPVLHARGLAQRVVDVRAQKGLKKALAIAREERVEFTTPQPGEHT